MKNLLRFATIINLLALATAAHAQIAIVSSANSSATSLTTDQAASLYLGKTSQLPGAGSVILLDQAVDTAVRDQFYAKLTGKSAAQVKSVWTRLAFSGKAVPPREAANSAEVKRQLASNPDAIGYINKSEVDDSVKVLLVLN